MISSRYSIKNKSDAVITNTIARKRLIQVKITGYISATFGVILFL